MLDFKIHRYSGIQNQQLYFNLKANGWMVSLVLSLQAASMYCVDLDGITPPAHQHHHDHHHLFNHYIIRQYFLCD